MVTQTESAPAAAVPGEAMIETHGLRKTFKARGRTVEAVADVDLAVRAGEIFGFLGPNGPGKTTTLRMLATLLPPDGGSARIAGCDLRTEPRRVRERIGYVGQAGGTTPMATGRGELVLQGRLYGMSKAQARARAAELLAMVELEAAADRPTKTYSGGQRRRLDVALGLAHRPRVLFLDEPTTGLDPQSRAHLWDEVRALHRSGVTIFLTTHYLDEADALCDRVAIIDEGRIVAEGTPPSSSAGSRATSSRSASRAGRGRRWTCCEAARSCARPQSRVGACASTWTAASRRRPRSCGCSTAPASASTPSR
jgi:ABC-2 type transport system ATP-binding protein